MKKWFAVIGNPISQSLSPMMHTHWFEENNIDAAYIPISVEIGQLKEAVNSLKLLGVSGWNVTIPFKTEIIPFLDEIDDNAKKMGAVNTVVKTSDGKFVGYNTDGLGYVKSLEEEIGEHHKGGNILIVGAGGAARGIVHALISSGYSSITITNRTLSNAEKLRDDSGAQQAISIREAEEKLSQFDILIQTTSAGMINNQTDYPLELSKLSDSAIVSDIVYNPIQTPILTYALKKDLKVVNGVGMFVHQGALAFSYWTGTYPNTKNMKTLLTEHLGGNHVNR